jgi:hypothetical protein
MNWTKTRFSHHFSVVCLLFGTTSCLFLAGPHPALAAGDGESSSGVSLVRPPAEILFDPTAIGSASSEYVSGNPPPATIVQGPIGGSNINAIVGANAFYTNNFTGTNAVVANIEAGHLWSAHETMGHVQQIPNHPSALNEVDRHSTEVGMIIGGRPLAGANEYQRGMAPDAQLYSGAFAAQWSGTRFTTGFSFFYSAYFDQYRRAFSSGVNFAGRTADVINSSFGLSEPGDGSGQGTMAIDAFINMNPRTLFVAAAGNSGAAPGTVVLPAAGYNGLSVAALGPNPAYNTPSFFTSNGPMPYGDPSTGTIAGVRQAVDIAAPGQELSSAYYGGTTGGNGTTDNPSVGGPGPTGGPSGPAGGPDIYIRGIQGTSFASPTVAGGAALLYDAAYAALGANPDARDSRVIKSVLMNSADKIPGWNNGQSPHPNGQGGVQTTQGLDNRVGTGRMNLANAYDQFLGGTTDVLGTASGSLGLVDAIGWDFGQVVNGTTNDYFFNTPLAAGSQFTATLTWFRDRRISEFNTLNDDSYDNLNLELWNVVAGIPTTLISESRSQYNSSEHFSFALPATGDYALRVRWFGELFDVVGDANQEFYGVAWATAAVPEPASVVLLVAAALFCGIVLRRRHG